MIETLFERLARRPGYARREVQSRMGAAVLRTLTDGGRLLVEAPTGIGKSLAYLLPLAAWLSESSDRRAVVATNTKALQRQLVEQDLAVLADLLDEPMAFALAMGGENYVCLRRLQQVRQLKLFDASDGPGIDRLFQWAVSTETGLRAEISVPNALWAEICRIGDLCFGRDCLHRNRCRYLLARAGEHRARILVVNHHLLLSDWAAGVGVLPPFQALVIDEAHRFEDAARSILTRELSSRRVNGVLNALLAVDGRRGLLTRFTEGDSSLLRTLEEQVRRLRSRFALWFAALAAQYPPPSAVTLTLSSPLPEAPEEDLARLATAINDIVPASEEGERERDAAAARCLALVDEIRTILSLEQRNAVHWIEHDGTGPRLLVSPLDVAPPLREGFFPGLETAVLTSATLAAGSDFSFLRNRLGIDWAEELVLESPFDFSTAALLYIPRNIPDPRTEGYARSLVHHIGALAESAGGGVLVLFTSHATMRLVRGMLDESGTPGRTAVEILMQGDGDPYTLIEEFRAHPRAVLLGTHTFWQGVDIPGDDLRCVVITRLPFAVPDTPLARARFEQVSAEGGNPFFEEQLPQAVLLFKQGFGRLIRRQEDRGVVAVLDSRIVGKSYGKRFLSALPPCPTTVSLDEVRNFFRATGRTAPA